MVCLGWFAVDDGAVSWTAVALVVPGAVLALGRRGGLCCHGSSGRYSVLTAWPPNWLRSAASTFARVALVLAAAEACQQRQRDDRRRHVVVDRVLHRPAALA